MAKLKTDPITAPDLCEFLDTSSDFAFEIAVLKSLTEHGFECEHGGTYMDSATKKPRQFDIRAKRAVDNFIVRLAVECKNLRQHFPLLVSCLPRSKEDSFHDIVPIILMEQNGRGAPTYYGRRDIVDFLANIDFRQLPWRQWTLN